MTRTEAEAAISRWRSFSGVTEDRNTLVAATPWLWTEWRSSSGVTEGRNAQGSGR